MLFAFKFIKMNHRFKPKVDSDVVQSELDSPNKIINSMNEDAPPTSADTG